MKFTTLMTGAMLVFIPAASAWAQDAAPPERNVFEGDRLTVGAGVIYGPSYDGSDDYVASPIPLLQGSVAGIAINPRPGGVALDVVKDSPSSRINYSFGPVATFSNNRVNDIKDPVVRAAGKLDTAVELGVSGGVSLSGVLHSFDSVTLSADMKWDVAGAHSGRVFNPGISYLTPLSRGSFISLSLGAKHVDDDYGDYYYSVSPEQSAASGLPQYQADGGWNSVSVGLLGGYDFNGNALDGGLSLFALASYSRLLNDAKVTPYTSIRGDADQFSAGIGLGYTF